MAPTKQLNIPSTIRAARPTFRGWLLYIDTIIRSYKDEIGATSTAVIALFTIILAVSTVFLWLITKRSVRLSERALVDLEGPLLGVKITNAGLEFHRHGPQGTGFTVGYLRFCFTNYGRTPAFITEFFQDSKVVEVGFPDRLDPSITRGAPMPHGIVVPPKDDSEIFEHGVLSDIGHLGGDKNIFFLGFVHYTDIFDNSYVCGFCFLFHKESNRWVLAGGTKYNYRHKENKPPTMPDWYQPTADPDSVRTDIFSAITKLWRNQ